ncbi:MAG TPA: 3-(methylthio)propionyl-CoA ligase [Stellaceae bacterium]|jgi:fatty-acyl-CoA synthase|nr:3-(methylthio)propionyl-CoA ligase [Stellaceae bacterium]
MHGLMQGRPLLISSLIGFADGYHGATEIVSRSIEGPIHRYTYREAHRRARRLANVLRRLGVAATDRVGTLAWNGYRHFEIYYAVSGMGAVCHTINPRLFPEQIVYIINHAEDRYVFFDITFAPLVAKLRPHCPGVRGWVAMTDRAHLPKEVPDALCYEELMAAEGDDFEWPALDEDAASSLCYTSGTTGNPKGVLYSHRSTVLHSYGAALPDAMRLSAGDVVLPVVPMFHANAWGLAYACPLVGAKLVFPGAALDGESLFELFEGEKVTFSGGVPTVWLALLHYMAETRHRFTTLKRTVIGGSACPPAMIRAFEVDHGVEVLHAWGMTEMSPLGTVCQLKAVHRDTTQEQQLAVKNKQGRAIFGVDLKIVDAAGKDLPWDGKAFGDLLVRGPWIAKGYFKGEGGDPLRGGWFPTGDVATIDPDGYIQITDRSKDVIKSGGEWISSIELENVAIAHPAVAEAAVIGVAHPKWDERPLLIVQRKPGAALTREELLAFYADKVAKWWIPDDVVFVEALPHTATGKLLKTKLREDFAAHRLPSS